jgi:DNA invertase Pin-like site-specific DNA recombinase
VRCAIYTRVSSDAGLEQDFNSLDAQQDAAQAYIRSQAHAGWMLLRSNYSDGGFSGGDTDRPALQRLLDDVRAGKIDVIVVYKVDRLTRSLTDFAKLVKLFDRHGVSFVSVTQQFNTTTSMGRLTLNILLSFAQFEREVTAERIRDKIAASKRKGLWVGGMVPLGYDSRNRKIAVNEAEAARVRSIFEGYLKLGSLSLLLADLRKRGIVTKVQSAGGEPAEHAPDGVVDHRDHPAAQRHRLARFAFVDGEGGLAGGVGFAALTLRQRKIEKGHWGLKRASAHYRIEICREARTEIYLQ